MSDVVEGVGTGVEGGLFARAVSPARVAKRRPPRAISPKGRASIAARSWWAVIAINAASRPISTGR